LETLQLSKERCWYCGVVLICDPNSLSHNYTRDHQNPEGGNQLSNLVACCKTCNCRKGHKTVEAYRQWLWDKTPVGQAWFALRDALSTNQLSESVSSKIVEEMTRLETGNPKGIFFGERNMSS
jgi:hypothetical protein